MCEFVGPARVLITCAYGFASEISKMVTLNVFFEQEKAREIQCCNEIHSPLLREWFYMKVNVSKRTFTKKIMKSALTQFRRISANTSFQLII